MADLDQSGLSLSGCPQRNMALKVTGPQPGQPPVPASLTFLSP